jgi:membrane protein
MSRFSEKLQKAKDFLGRDVWEFEPAELSRARAFLLRQTQVALLVVRDFQADRCLLRASALTYVTLLSIVPVFALMFSLLKGLGVQNTLEPIILKEIAIGSEQIVTEIIRYINNTHVGRLGTVGLITLVLTVLALLSNIEETFNTIWGVQETRSLYRRFSDYFSVLIFGPIFVLVAISMTTTLESQAFVQTLMEMAYVGEVIYFLFKVLPFIAMWAAFTFLYIFMPNIKVDFRAALIGGIFGGTLWQLAQWSYLFFQVGVARYNAIYGTMAALPIFMVWIYVSWIIVLLGMEVSYAYQHLRHIRLEIRGETVNFASREMIALTILLQVAEAFNRGEKPWRLRNISEGQGLPPRLARSVIEELVRLRFLSVVRVGEDVFAYQPARALKNMKVHSVVKALKEDGVNVSRMYKTPEWKIITDLERQIEQAGRDSLGELTLEDLVAKMAGQKKEEEGERKNGENQ